MWTVKELAEVLGAQGQLFDTTAVNSINIDTRTLQPGDVFVALSGTPSGGFVSSFASTGDGHQWVKTAEQKGAVAVVVSQRQRGVNIPQLVVRDTLMDGLWKIGAAARARVAKHGGTVIGLTGSAGKSGTKEFLAAMLPDSYASPNSYNNFWGVPLTLANALNGAPAEARYVVSEIGMNRPGEIARLSMLVKPDVALVTNIRPVHLEALGSLEAIRQEKLAIRLGLTDGGTLVIPHDVDLTGLEQLPGRVIRFGGSKALVHAEDWHAHGSDWHVRARVDGEEIEFMLQQGAPHRLENALAALAACWACGLDVPALRDCAQRIGLVGTMPGRGVESVAGGVTLIDDSFNANPASVTAALSALGSRVVRGRRIAILGDMLELGSESPAYHAGLAGACQPMSGVVCVGPLMKHLYDALPTEKRLGYYPDPAALEPRALAKLLVPGDSAVIKGSKKIFWVRDFAKKLLTELEK